MRETVSDWFASAERGAVGAESALSANGESVEFAGFEVEEWDVLEQLSSSRAGEGESVSPSEVVDLGLFGFFADWLVETRSFDFAVVAGMIGFGLFGSVVSRIVQRGDRLSDPSHPTAFAIIGSGVGAALIVFLLVKGGLAAIGPSDAEPNAYVMFALCLVGSAFADRVWGPAADRLLSAFSRAVDAASGRREQPRAPDEDATRTEDAGPDSGALEGTGAPLGNGDGASARQSAHPDARVEEGGGGAPHDRVADNAPKKPDT